MIHSERAIPWRGKNAIHIKCTESPKQAVAESLLMQRSLGLRNCLASEGESPLQSSSCSLHHSYLQILVMMEVLTKLGLQLHALVMAIFASVIAPFGGFFASGFKRSFKIKDFGDSIPGHGGMTDRMDCQVSLFLNAIQTCGSVKYSPNCLCRTAPLAHLMKDERESTAP